jgi:exopolyphosphatase/guanosine-5'-triphosphate,3'-diphosphate pyrophosphatase
MILNDQTLPLTDRERSIVALVSCYHRKSFPSMDHGVYAALKNRDRKMVGALAALLRIADGLDYTHSNRISALSCSIRPGEVICTLESEGEFHVERARAIQKSDLFEQIFERKLRIP